MAIHWFISQRKSADEEKNERNLVERVRGSKITSITMEDLEAKFDGEWEGYSADDEDIEMEMDEEEHDDMEVDTNGDNSERFYEDVDLTRVDWDADWMKALIDVDMTIFEKIGERPQSDRIRWIDPVDGFERLFTKEDQLAEDLKKTLRLF